MRSGYDSACSPRRGGTPRAGLRRRPARDLGNALRYAAIACSSAAAGSSSTAAAIM